MDKVLVTNGILRKTLSCTRSLGRRGIPVYVSDHTLLTPSGFSKYCKKNLAYPSPTLKREAFLAWLENMADRYGCNVIFPMDDDTMDAVMQSRERLEKRFVLPLPSYESYQKATDKWSSVNLAMEAGLDCPMTIMPDTMDDLKNGIWNLQFPVVIKPRKSSGSRGIKIVGNRDELMEGYAEISRQYPRPLIQEFIPAGGRYDVCLLFDKNSGLRASFCQKEIRHYPLDIGPSTVQQSIKMDDLVEKSVKVFERLPWYGVIELEFMHDQRDGKLKFMEMNTRFWNSLEMAVIAGVDFPWLLYRAAIGEEMRPVTGYMPDVLCRNLLPGDILHYLSNKNRKEMTPPFWNKKGHEMNDDILSGDDPMPVLGFASACLRYALDIRMWRFLLRK